MLKSYYALSDKGPYFNNNQDAFYANLEYRVFGVVDGFGGTGIGDLVSANIIKSTHDVFSKSTMDRDATLKFFYDSRRSVECNFLINGILSFHENLMQENEQKSLYQRGAANCIFVIDQGQRVSVISVGKIYGLLIRDMMLKNLAFVDDGIGTEITDAIAVAESWTKSAIGLFSPLQFFINVPPAEVIAFSTFIKLSLVQKSA